MVYIICEIWKPVGNSTWLLWQILALRVSNTVMYCKLVSPISSTPSPMELKQKLDLWLYFMVYTLCENLKPVGNSTWLLGQIVALSVSNTVMHCKLGVETD